MNDGKINKFINTMDLYHMEHWEEEMLNQSKEICDMFTVNDDVWCKYDMDTGYKYHAPDDMDYYDYDVNYLVYKILNTIYNNLAPDNLGKVFVIMHPSFVQVLNTFDLDFAVSILKQLKIDISILIPIFEDGKETYIMPKTNLEEYDEEGLRYNKVFKFSHFAEWGDLEEKDIRLKST